MADGCEAKGNLASAAEWTWQTRVLHFFTIAGPGCMAMLADTDVGSTFQDS
jgi:Mn2+/Fe2+ NRAMP family transporter